MNRIGCGLVVLLLACTAMAGGTFTCKVPWYKTEAPCGHINKITIESGQTVYLTVDVIKEEDGTVTDDKCATVWLADAKTGINLTTLRVCRDATDEEKKDDSWENTNDTKVVVLLTANVSVLGTRIIEGGYTIK